MKKTATIVNHRGRFAVDYVIDDTGFTYRQGGFETVEEAYHFGLEKVGLDHSKGVVMIAAKY